MSMAETIERSLNLVYDATQEAARDEQGRAFVTDDGIVSGAFAITDLEYIARTTDDSSIVAQCSYLAARARQELARRGIALKH